MALFGLFSKKKKESLDKGLEKTKESVFKKLSRAIVGKSKVDEEVLDNLEEVLISSDVGVDTTLRVIRRIEERVQRDKYVGVNELNRILKEAAEARDNIIRQAREQARDEADKLLTEAKTLIEAEKESALSQIRSQVAMLSVNVAEKILRETLSSDKEQKALIDRMVEESLKIDKSQAGN